MNYFYSASPRMTRKAPAMTKPAVGRIVPASGTAGIGAGVGVATGPPTGGTCATGQVQSVSDTHDGFLHTPAVFPVEIKQIIVDGQSAFDVQLVLHCGYCVVTGGVGVGVLVGGAVGVGVGVGVEHKQSDSSTHEAFRQLPLEQIKSDGQSLFILH